MKSDRYKFYILVTSKCHEIHMQGIGIVIRRILISIQWHL